MFAAAAGPSCDVAMVSVRSNGLSSGKESYSCLCVVSLEGALSSFILRPASRMRISPIQGPFLSICYKLCSSQSGFGNEPPSL